VCDFGSTRNFQQSFIQTTNNNMMGTHGYAAPECYEGEIDERFEILKKQDIWAIGIIIHQLLTNNHPFITKGLKSIEELKIKVINGDFTLHSSLKDTVYEKIIQSCFRVKPRRRVEISELLEMFRIIYAIYEKYRDEEEAERVLMEETYRIKGIHYEEHVSRKDIRKKMKGMMRGSDEESSSDSSGRKRRKKQGGGTVVNKKVITREYDEEEDRGSRKKKRKHRKRESSEEPQPP